MSRYKQLLHYATRLDPLPAELHIPENKVEGCVSQVWVAGHLDATTGMLIWQADSDSQLTKARGAMAGLAALLVIGLSGLSPQETVAIPTHFITSLGFQQALTPSRNNGFLNMFRHMQRRALELCLTPACPSTGQADAEPAAPTPAGTSSGTDQLGAVAEGRAEAGTGQGAAPETAEPQESVLVASIRHKIALALRPLSLEVVEGSGQEDHRVKERAGSGGMTPRLALTIVSPRFEGLSTMKRHRLVHATLAQEMQGLAPALTLNTQTPDEAGV